MNNRLYNEYSKLLNGKIPEAFVANSNRYASTDKGALYRNYRKYREAVCIRFWLYLDLTFEPSKALRWIEVYCQLDQLSAEKSLAAIYEFFRRENLLSYSVSQFKAAFGSLNGISVRWWLGPLWYRVEDLLLKDSALVSESEYISLIRDVVQWTRLSSKLKLENPLLGEEAYQRFEANELRLRDLWSRPDEVRDQYLKGMARIVDTIIDQRNFQPGLGHHGNGAVREKDCERHSWLKHKYLGQTNDRTKFFDRRFSFTVNPQDYESLEFPQESVLPDDCRSSTVPKNIEKERFIAMQSVARMYRQEAVLQGYYRQWRSSSYCRKHFPIFDRTVNQRLALKGSRRRVIHEDNLPYEPRSVHGWCTIDLQSASDSVTVHLVKACTKWNLRACLLLNRAKRIGNLQLLATYATMGDATVFPTETLLIGAAVQLALDLSRSQDPSIPNHFLVFGDDIICPNSQILLKILHDIFARIGFIINDDKSFYNGPYRESCGVEAYLGWEIQPWYARIPSEGLERLESLVGAANSLYERGYRLTRRYMINEYANGLKCSVKLLPFTENFEDSSRFHTDSVCYGKVRVAKTPSGELAFGQLERLELKPVTRVSAVRNERLLAIDDAYKLTQWHYKQYLSDERPDLFQEDSLSEIRFDVRYHKTGQHNLHLKRSWASVEDLRR
jgi:hypothetical protein